LMFLLLLPGDPDDAVIRLEHLIALGRALLLWVEAV
jgi:hypothetical protein